MGGLAGKRVQAIVLYTTLPYPSLRPTLRPTLPYALPYLTQVRVRLRVRARVRSLQEEQRLRGLPGQSVQAVVRVRGFPRLGEHLLPRHEV